MHERRFRSSRARPLFLVTFFFFHLFSQNAWSQEPPDKVTEAAVRGLPEFLRSLPANSNELYGLGPTDADISLEKAVPVYSISSASLAAYQPGDTVDKLMSPTSLWYAPVSKSGQVKAILVVDRMDSEWKAVSFGYGRLAPSVSAALKAFPLADGYHPKVIAAFAANKFFLSVPERGAYDLTPIFPGESMATIPPVGKDLVRGEPALSRTVSELREAITEGIQ